MGDKLKKKRYFKLANLKLKSRLIVEPGNIEILEASKAIKESGADMVTVIRGKHFR